VCELFALSSRLPATVKLSLQELASHGGKVGPHRDGWGIAFYSAGDVRLIREEEAAAHSPCERFLEEHDFRSRRVISHIRLATQGERALRNTQPFARELGGRMHVFAHNGKLPGVEDEPGMGLGRFRPIGETDSEHAFCALLGRMEDLWSSSDAVPELSARLEVFADFAAELRPLGPANLLYSDGEALFVHGHRRTQSDGEIRWPGLHQLCRTCAAGEGSLEAAGLSVATADRERQEVVLIASVPLTDEGWQPLGEGEVLVLDRGQILARREAPRARSQPESSFQT